MFKIRTNNFANLGIVNYIDDDGNRITVIGEKDGSAFKVKIRPVANIKVNTLEFTSPYNVTGVTLTNNPLDMEANDYINTEEYQNMLKEAIGVAELWTYIQSEKQILVNNAFKLTEDVVEDILTGLKQYEESREFAELYEKLLRSGSTTQLIN